MGQNSSRLMSRSLAAMGRTGQRQAPVESDGPAICRARSTLVPHLLFGRVQPVQVGLPTQQSLVGGGQGASMRQARGGDHPVGWIAVEAIECRCTDSDAPVQGKFAQPCCEKVLSPGVERHVECQPPFPGEHCNLPETDGRNCQPVIGERFVQCPSAVGAKTRIVLVEPNSTCVSSRINRTPPNAHRQIRQCHRECALCRGEDQGGYCAADGTASA